MIAPIPNIAKSAAPAPADIEKAVVFDKASAEAGAGGCQLHQMSYNRTTDMLRWQRTLWIKQIELLALVWARAELNCLDTWCALSQMPYEKFVLHVLWMMVEHDISPVYYINI